MKVFDGWLGAETLDGPWTVQKESDELKKALADAKASGQVDFLPGGNPNDAKTLPSLKSGKVPVIFVATTPSELIVTEGEPQYVKIPGTELEYVKNTTGNMLRSTADQKLYLLLSGRWFRSASDAGPWEYVASDALPKDFATIPDDSEKENVKAAVAGTPQAKEALIANAIPQTAEVKIQETKIDPPKFDGEVKLAPVEGHVASVRRQHRDAHHPGERHVVVRGPGRRLVHGQGGGRAVVGRDVRAARDLHDPGDARRCTT